MDDSISRFQKSHEELEAVISRFSDEELITPGKVGEWSVREVIGHLAAWNNWGHRAIELRLTSDNLPAEMAEEVRNPDPFNAHAVESWKTYTAGQARAVFSESYEELMRFLETTPHDKLYREIIRPNGKTTSPISSLSVLAHHANEHRAELEALLDH